MMSTMQSMIAMLVQAMLVILFESRRFTHSNHKKNEKPNPDQKVPLEGTPTKAPMAAQLCKSEGEPRGAKTRRKMTERIETRKMTTAGPGALLRQKCAADGVNNESAYIGRLLRLLRLLLRRRRLLLLLLLLYYC